MAAGERDPAIQRVVNEPEQDLGGADFRITNPKGRKRQAYEEAGKRYIGTTGDGAKQATLSTCGEGRPRIGS